MSKTVDSIDTKKVLSDAEIKQVKEVFQNRFDFQIENESHLDLIDPKIAEQYDNLLADTRLIGVPVANEWFVFSPSDELVWFADPERLYDSGKTTLVYNKKQFEKIIKDSLISNANIKRLFFGLSIPFFIFALVFVGLMIANGSQWAGWAGIVFSSLIGGLLLKKSADIPTKPK